MRTIIGVCVDESGSMDEGGKRDAAIGAFNEYLRDQQKLTSDECLMTITKFNTDAVRALALTPIAKVPDLSRQNYNPGGGTALFDAIAQCVQTIEQDVVAGDRIVLVVLTDGEENSSQRTTLEKVREIINTKEATGTWTFVFLSASPDAFAQGAQYGFAAGNTAAYANTAAGTQSAVGMMSHSTTNYRMSAASASKDFMAPQAPPPPQRKRQPPSPSPVPAPAAPLQPMTPKP